MWRYERGAKAWCRTALMCQGFMDPRSDGRLADIAEEAEGDEVE